MLTIYLMGVVVTAVGACVQSRFLRDDRGPAPRNLLGVAVLAGLVWPVVLLGVIQFGVVVLVQRGARRWLSPVEPETSVVTELPPERTGHLIPA
ncbi:hypothetical protein BH09ACT7_BH09ACT7_16170 [soil metagenome]